MMHCNCGWNWVLDLAHGQIIGPFYASISGTECEILISNPRVMTLEAFADDYADCFAHLVRKALA